jgi:hypothetical protein
VYVKTLMHYRTYSIQEANETKLEKLDQSLGLPGQAKDSLSKLVNAEGC